MKEKGKLLIIIDPTDGQTDTISWKSHLNIIIYNNGNSIKSTYWDTIYMVSRDNPMIRIFQKQGILDNTVYSTVKIIGHGGDGSDFLHFLDTRTVANNLKALLNDIRIKQDTIIDFQMCSAGKPISQLGGDTSFQEEATPVGQSSKAPVGISYIYGSNQKIDLPPNFSIQDMKNVAKFLTKPNTEIQDKQDVIKTIYKIFMVDSEVLNNRNINYKNFKDTNFDVLFSLPIMQKTSIINDAIKINCHGSNTSYIKVTEQGIEDLGNIELIGSLKRISFFGIDQLKFVLDGIQNGEKYNLKSLVPPEDSSSDLVELNGKIEHQLKVDAELSNRAPIKKSDEFITYDKEMPLLKAQPNSMKKIIHDKKKFSQISELPGVLKHDHNEEDYTHSLVQQHNAIEVVDQVN